MDEPHGGRADVVIAKVPDYSALKHVLLKAIGHLRECAKRGLGRLEGFKEAFLGLDGRGDFPKVPNMCNPLEALLFRKLFRLEPLLAAKRMRRK